MTEGCPERLDLEFFYYVLTFRRNWSKRNHASLAGFSGNVLRFHRPADAEKFLSDLAV